MIKEFKLIRVDCDGCGKFYPSTKDPVHFQDVVSANNTVFEDEWMIIAGKGKPSHLCPECRTMTKNQSNLIHNVDEE